MAAGTATALVVPAMTKGAPLAAGTRVLATPAYEWVGDTILQGPFRAWAPSDHEIRSTYHAQPTYYMPVDQTWTLQNDISKYPALASSSTLLNAFFNMGLDEMVNLIENDQTIRTGKEWPGVWTRDVSYSILLSLAALEPEVARVSLEHKITPNRRIMQDTGSGGAWPVSTDREVWTLAAWEVYKATGDRTWLARMYPVALASMEDDYKSIYDNRTGLVKGETSFIDWREQSHPRWMQTADIAASQALGTNVVHAQAWRTLAEMASELGESPQDIAKFRSRAQDLDRAINSNLWLDDKGYYGMYLYGRDYPIMNPRAETLGESLAILYDVASPSRAKTVTEKVPVTPYGPAIFFPQIKDQPAYHNNALWPFVGAYWTLANAKAANEQGALEGFGSLLRPAALFATNKENFNLDNGDIATELNSSNMLWAIAGNLSLTLKMLFGIHYQADGISFAPFVPRALADTRTLSGLHYRDAILNITVEGYGNRIRRFTLNGREHEPFISADIHGLQNIHITLDDNPIMPLRVNHTANVKAPLTPQAWLRNDPELNNEQRPVNNLLEWNPIEYIHHYIVLRNGKQVARTRETRFPALEPGEYQVIAVDDNGIESFASEPRSNAAEIILQMPTERSVMTSSEASNVPRGPMTGYRGPGFAEVDHATGTIALGVDIPATGQYSISLRYANGNGPVNTENKCAIRTLLVDGVPAGSLVMPQRGVGNWTDWGMTNALPLTLSAGRHILTIRFLPTDENMNLRTNHALIDELHIRRL